MASSNLSFDSLFASKKSYTQCPHFSDLSFNYLESRFSTVSFRIHFTERKMECNLCDGSTESLWACLQCNFIGCNEHVLKHFHQKKNQYLTNPTEYDLHSLMISLRSVEGPKSEVNSTEAISTEAVEIVCFCCEAKILSALNVSSNSQKQYHHKITPQVIQSFVLGSPLQTSNHQTNVGIGSDNSCDPDKHDDNQMNGSTPHYYFTSTNNNNSKYLTSTRGLCGLENLGNTCYMNAAIQSLSNCEPFVQYFLKSPHCSSKWPLYKKYRISNSFCKTLAQIWAGNQKHFSPSRLLKDVVEVTEKFSGYYQQDSQEFIRCLVNRLHEELLLKVQQENSVIERSPISDIFEGKYLSKVKCLKCEKESLTTEKFHDIQLSIPDSTQLVQTESTGFFGGLSTWLGFSRRAVSLEDCLHLFCSPEQLILGEENNYFCEHCKEKVNSEKQMQFYQLPEVLCFHIKRFRYDSYWSTKISDHVELPLEGLNLSNYCAPPQKKEDTIPEEDFIYDLVSITNHSGALGGGHYIAYAKNFKTKKWYEFDDSRVSEVSTKDVLNAEAYFVLYQRRMSPQRKAEIQQIKKMISSRSDSSVYISKEWWTKFKTQVHPGPLHCYRKFLCPHGALQLQYSEKEFKKIPKNVFLELVKTYGDTPEITSLSQCESCQQYEFQLEKRREKEKSFVAAKDTTIIKTGEKWYLIHCEWIQRWLNFIKNQGEPPGPITNDYFFQDKEFTTLKPNLRKGVDYRVLVPDVWNFFHSTYGGGPEIKRSVSHPKVIYDKEDVTTSDDEN